MLKFYVKVFYLMGKALTGELSCPCESQAMTGLVGSPSVKIRVTAAIQTFWPQNTHMAHGNMSITGTQRIKVCIGLWYFYGEW